MSDAPTLQPAFKAAVDHSKPVYIETPRLILRETLDTDIDAFRGITTHPGFYYYCFDGSEEKLQSFMDTCKATQIPNPATGMRDMFMLAVTLKDTGEVIGHASLLRITEYTLPVTGIDYEAAYFIDSKQGGKAYGQEALLNTMHHGFSALGLPALGSMQELDNAQAISIASKVLGFKKVDECIGQTVKGPKPHQVCIVTPDDFYALRQNDKRVYISPDSLAKAPKSGRSLLDSGTPAP